MTTFDHPQPDTWIDRLWQAYLSPPRETYDYTCETMRDNEDRWKGAKVIKASSRTDQNDVNDFQVEQSK